MKTLHYHESGQRVENVIEKTRQQKNTLLQQLRTQKERIERIRSEVEKGQERLDELAEKKKAIQSEMDRLSAEKAGFESSLASLIQPLKEINAEEERISGVVSHLHKKFIEVDTQVTQLEKDIERYRSDLEAETDEQKRLDELQDQLERERAAAEKIQSINAGLLKLCAKVELPSTIMKKADFKQHLSSISTRKDNDDLILSEKRKQLDENREDLQKTGETLEKLSRDIEQGLTDLESQRPLLQQTRESKDQAVDVQRDVLARQAKLTQQHEQTRERLNEALGSLNVLNEEGNKNTNEQEEHEELIRKATSKLPGIRKTLNRLLPIVRQLLENPSESIRKISHKDLVAFFDGIEQAWGTVLSELRTIAQGSGLTLKDIPSEKLKLDVNNPQEALNRFLSAARLQEVFAELIQKLETLQDSPNKGETINGVKGLASSFAVMEKGLQEHFPEFLKEKGAKIRPLTKKDRLSFQKLLKSIEEILKALPQ